MVEFADYAAGVLVVVAAAVVVTLSIFAVAIALGMRMTMTGMLRGHGTPLHQAQASASLVPHFRRAA